MTIIRDGKEIPLTKDELYAAFEEQRSNYDAQDIAMVIDDWLADDMTDDEELAILKDIRASKNALWILGCIKREYEDTQACNTGVVDWRAAAADAIYYEISHRRQAKG